MTEVKLGQETNDCGWGGGERLEKSAIRQRSSHLSFHPYFSHAVAWISKRACFLNFHALLSHSPTHSHLHSLPLFSSHTLQAKRARVLPSITPSSQKMCHARRPGIPGATVIKSELKNLKQVTCLVCKTLQQDFRLLPFARFSFSFTHAC